MKHQGRADIGTSDPMEPKCGAELARMVGESVTQIKRYIRLMNLPYSIKVLKDPISTICKGVVENKQVPKTQFYAILKLQEFTIQESECHAFATLLLFEQ